MTKEKTTINICGDPAQDNSHQICSYCGHYRFLHLNNFKGECDACDSPEIPIEKRCPGFQEKN